MEFWKMVYDQKWVTKEELKGAVQTANNPYGEITPEQFEEITGEKFTEFKE